MKLIRTICVLLSMLAPVGSSADERSLPEEPGNKLSERFYPSGIESDRVINDFFQKIKALVESGDKVNLSKLRINGVRSTL